MDRKRRRRQPSDQSRGTDRHDIADDQPYPTPTGTPRGQPWRDDLIGSHQGDNRRERHLETRTDKALRGNEQNEYRRPSNQSHGIAVRSNRMAVNTTANIRNALWVGTVAPEIRR